MGFNLLKGLTKGHTASKWQVSSGQDDLSGTLHTFPIPPPNTFAQIPSLAMKWGPTAADLVAGRALHHNSGPHGKRGHRQHSDDHPLGPGVARLHAQDKALLVRDALKDLVHPLRAQQDLLLLRVLIDMLPFCI